MLNVKDFGAKGDGFTDDTRAFQNAVNMAQAGAAIRVPPGRYRLVAPRTLGKGPDSFGAVTVTRGGIRFVGDNVEASVIVQGTPNSVPILVRAPKGVGVGFEALTFEGHPERGNFDPTQTASPTDGSGALLYVRGGSVAEPVRDLEISGCRFQNPMTVGIYLGWVKGARITNNHFSHYDGIADADDHNLGPHVGIFSAEPPVYDLAITSNTFVGNSRDNVAGQPEVKGADGFVFISKGGGVNISGNTIRNFFFEGIQVVAMPAVISGNTLISRNSATCCTGIMTWQDTADKAESPDVLITGNTIIGSGTGTGISMKTTDTNPCYPFTANIVGNIIRNFKYGVLATNARVLALVGNHIDRVTHAFDNTNSSTSKDCGMVQFTSNRLTEVSECALFLNARIGVLQMSGNLIQSAAAHLWIYDPTTPISIGGGNVYLDGAGKILPVPIYLQGQTRFDLV